MITYLNDCLDCYVLPSEAIHLVFSDPVHIRLLEELYILQAAFAILLVTIWKTKENQIIYKTHRTTHPAQAEVRCSRERLV